MYSVFLFVPHWKVSPFGNVLLFACLVYDRSGRTTLDHDCASRKWRLCHYLDVLPPHPTPVPISDHFIWQSDGPLAHLGGAKMITGEAGQITMSEIEEHPGAVFESSMVNIGRQFLRCQSGDGMQCWPHEVEPVIKRSFPAA